MAQTRALRAAAASRPPPRGASQPAPRRRHWRPGSRQPSVAAAVLGAPGTVWRRRARLPFVWFRRGQAVDPSRPAMDFTACFHLVPPVPLSVSVSRFPCGLFCFWQKGVVCVCVCTCANPRPDRGIDASHSPDGTPVPESTSKGAASG